MTKRKRKKKAPPVTKNNPVTENIRDTRVRNNVDSIRQVLLRIANEGGRRLDRVFEDWIRMLDAMLTMMPAHVAAMREQGICAQDPPEIVALFESVQQKYPHADVRNLFARATATLLESVNTGYADTVGTVYMAINAENKYAGQYFTPYPIASLMAHLNIGEGPRRVIERIIQAVNRAIDSPNAPATLKASRLMGRLSALRDNENLRKADFPDDMPLWLAEHWQLIRPHFHPLTINDPAVGSGVMLLAAAELFPKWMLQLGFVQFYGQDIDELCVLMANINIKLYGLNGFGAQMMHALVGPPRIQKGTQRLAEEKL